LIRGPLDKPERPAEDVVLSHDLILRESSTAG